MENYYDTGRFITLLATKIYFIDKRMSIKLSDKHLFETEYAKNSASQLELEPSTCKLLFPFTNQFSWLLACVMLYLGREKFEL